MEHSLAVEAIYENLIGVGVKTMSDVASRRQRPEAEDRDLSQDELARTARPWRITFDTNPDDCNLHCIMCEDHSPYSTTQSDRRREGRPKRRMGIDLIRQVMAESRGTGLREIIPSTMGEPLLYRHFDEILDLCAEYGVKLNLTTNGTFPQRGAKGVGRANRARHVGRKGVLEWRDQGDP